jgi:von Willebrand factor type A domain
MPAPSFLSGLPKPLLFGLYGAVGGLLGALVFGEPAWNLLKPPAAPPAPPQLAVAASAGVQLYPKSENTFAVQIARERFDSPVTVKFDKMPAGMTIASITIPGGKTDGQATVATAADVVPGKYPVKLTAEAEKVESATGDTTIEVLPTPLPPPGLAVAIPSNFVLYRNGTSKFTASVARRRYDGPIALGIESLPAGVTFAPNAIPANVNEVEVTLTAIPDAVIGNTKLNVTASVADPPLKESAPTQLAIQAPPIAPVDIVFVLDVTASMQWGLGELKEGSGKFADALSKAQIDFRFGLVTFQDLEFPGEKVEAVLFKNGDRDEPFTNNAAIFRNKVGELKAEGGGPDVPESSLEGVVEATKLPFRKGATRLLLLITDAPPKIRGTTMKDAIGQIKEKSIDSVHLAVLKQDQDVYKTLMAAGSDKVGGKFFDLREVVRNEEGFDELFASFSKTVADAARAKSPEGKPQVAPSPDPPRIAAAAATTPKSAEAPAPPAIQSVQSSGQFAAGSEGKLTLAIGVWTGAISALVCLVLLGGQHHYLRGSLPSLGGIAAGLLGGLVVGTAGGAAGQGLFMLSSAMVFRVLGWALLGGMAGAGLSFFIPNMKWFLGLAGGAIGGAVGAMGYIAVTAVAGDQVGRLVGGLLLGFCIGLMVAIVEAAFRRAWLEVRYGREIISVNLGPEPVKVGGDAKACTVWARGAAPIALRFFLREGKVICDDATMRRESPVGDGFAKEVGNVTVTVRTGSGAVAAPPMPPPPAPTSRKATVDDDFELPMPILMSPPVAKPQAAMPAKPPSPPPPVAKPPAPPAPVAAKPPAPPPKPPAPPMPLAAKPSAPPAPPPMAPPAPPAKPPAPPAPVAAKPPVAPPAPPKPSAPAAPAAAKHPDACPSCGRVNAGKPRQRYCMVCDNTY